MGALVCQCSRCNPETPARILACEARSLLLWPLGKRQAFLIDAEKKRGAPAIQALKDEMRRQWEIKQQAGCA